MSQRIDPSARPGESLGVLLTRLRQEQGKSQVRLAGLLCAASGLPTLTRNEISRWEREERVPSGVWLGWLALVLDTPIDDLERAAARTRRRREPTMTLTTTTSTPTPAPVTASPRFGGGGPARARGADRTLDGSAGPGGEGGAAHVRDGSAGPGRGGGTGDARTDSADIAEAGGAGHAGNGGAAHAGTSDTAHAGNGDTAHAGTGDAAHARGGHMGHARDSRARRTEDGGAGHAQARCAGHTAAGDAEHARDSRAGRTEDGDAGHARDSRAGPACDGGAGRRARIDELRRMDDLLAGPELLALVRAELRAAARDTAAGHGGAAQVAELAQLHSWVTADAGRRPPDGVQQAGVRAALAAGDRALAGHVLGCHAQVAAERGDGPDALRVAAAAERVAAGSDPATTTVLSLRVAFAAAQAGDRRACDAALASADHAYERRVRTLDPPWLYWLDDAHVDALAGLALAAAGRPAAALPRLAAALQGPAVRFRAAGLVTAAVAHAHLGTGDLDAACAAATETLLTCVGSGSFRVLHRLRRVEAALHVSTGTSRSAAALRGYAELAESVAAYLPGAAPAPARAPAWPAPARSAPARPAPFLTSPAQFRGREAS